MHQSCAISLTLAILVATACTGSQEAVIPPGPPAGLSHAYAAPSCAPWDGYAVSLVLRDDTLAATDSMIERGDGPQLHVGLYPRRMGGVGPSGLTPGTFRWPDEPEVAGGAHCESGRCQSAPSGRVMVRQVMPDGTFSGELEVLLKNGDTVRGGFRAEWRNRSMLCG